MNINDSTHSNLTLRATQEVSKTNQQAYVQPVAPAVEENNSNNQSENLAQNKSRFEVSEQAIRFLEEQSASPSDSSSSAIALRDDSNASNSSYAQGEQTTKSSQYDQPSQQNLSAVAAYESVGNIAQKESIKQFFGVNLFA